MKWRHLLLVSISIITYMTYRHTDIHTYIHTYRYSNTNISTILQHYTITWMLDQTLYDSYHTFLRYHSFDNNDRIVYNNDRIQRYISVVASFLAELWPFTSLHSTILLRCLGLKRLTRTYQSYLTFNRS
jgi:hypothetical protein